MWAWFQKYEYLKTSPTDTDEGSRSAARPEARIPSLPLFWNYTLKFSFQCFYSTLSPSQNDNRKQKIQRIKVIAWISKTIKKRAHSGSHFETMFLIEICVYFVSERRQSISHFCLVCVFRNYLTWRLAEKQNIYVYNKGVKIYYWILHCIPTQCSSVCLVNYCLYLFKVFKFILGCGNKASFDKVGSTHWLH